MKTLLFHGALAFLTSSVASAQTSVSTAANDDPVFSIELDREERADSCPELPWFEARIASHAGQAGQAGHFKLTLTRKGEAWHARIQRWERNRSSPATQRVLQDRSPDCAPLAEAAALTIALVAEDFAQHPEGEPAPPVKAVEQHPPKVTEAPTRSRANGSKVWVGAGGGIAMSWISPIAPALGFSVALDKPHWRNGLRALLTTEQKFPLDPGSVVVQAWLGSLYSCLQPTHASLGIALCGVLDASMVRASAEGFANGKPSTRAYGAAGMAVEPSWYVLDRYRISASLAVLVPFTRESFSVTGRGVAYIPPPLNWRILVFSEIGAF